MILTEKGSTRGTVSILFISTLVLLCARLLVVAIESATPQSVRPQISWQKIPDLLADQNVTFEKPTEPQVKPAAGAAQARRNTLKSMPLDEILSGNTKKLPILILYTDDNSVVCRNMEERSLSALAVQELIEKEFYPVRISFSKVLTRTEYRMYYKLGSSCVPELVVTTADGIKIDSAGGYLSAVKVYIFLKQSLKRIEKERAEFAGEQAREKTNVNDMPAIEKTGSTKQDTK